MTQLKQPALLDIVTPYTRDNLTPDIDRFANEASVSLRLIPNPELVQMLTRHGFTQRGATSWSVGTTDSVSLYHFAIEYLEAFVPHTLLAVQNGGSETSLLNAIKVFTPSEPTWPISMGYGVRYGENLSQAEVFRLNRGGVPSRVVNALSGVALTKENTALQQSYRNERCSHRGHDHPNGHGHYFGRDRERLKRILESPISLGALVVSESNNTLWVRLAYVTDATDELKAISSILVTPRMRNAAGESTKERFYKPVEVLEAIKYDARFVAVSTLLTEESKNWIAEIKKLEDAVTVGYTPGSPASTTVTVGSVLSQGKGMRRNRSIMNFLTKYPNTPEKGKVKTYEVSIKDVLDAKAKLKQIKFHVHPALEDIANMASAKPLNDETLYDYQREAVGLHLSTSIGYLNSCSTGLGKTVMTLRAYQEKAKSIKYYRAIVICEANVRNQWLEEAEKWFPEAEVCVVESAKDTDILIKALSSEKPVVIITSYTQTLLALETDEARRGERARIAMLPIKERIAYFSARQPETISVGQILLDTTWEDITADEATVIRNANSKQNNALWTLRQNSKVAVALTATPVNKSPDDIANLLSWVRNDRTLFTGDKPLSERYDTSKPKEAKALFNSFGPLVFRRDASAAGLSIPKVKQTVMLLKPNPAELMLANAAEKELKRVYKELVEALNEVDNLKDATIDPEELAKAKQQLKEANGAWLGGTTLARMAASDPLALTESKSVGAQLLIGQGLVEAAIKKVPTKRSKFIEDVVKRIENGQQALVFVSYTAVATRLVQHLKDAGIRAKAYTGKNSKTRDAARVEFQEGNLDVLVATQAAERGLTLHKASVIYHLDLPWTIEKLIQRTGRGVRIGSTNKEVEVIFLILQDTIEERIANHLVTNGVMASLIMDASRDTDLSKTETLSALSGLMTTMGRTEKGKSAIAFAKDVLKL